MRVSENQRYRQANEKIAKAKSDNAQALDTVSTMKNIRTISDDPTGLSRAIRYKDQITSYDQNLKNLELGKGFMETMEQALGGMTNNLVRAKGDNVVHQSRIDVLPASADVAMFQCRQDGYSGIET